MKPTVGSIVHFQSHGIPPGMYGLDPAPSTCRAAIVTEVTVRTWYGTPPPDASDEEAATVTLCVLNPTGQFFERGLSYSMDSLPGTWHWPEREPE